jgi:predicted transcriptional regulator
MRSQGTHHEYTWGMTTTTKEATTVRLPRSLVDEIREIAAAHDRSISAELRVALGGYVRQELPAARQILEERGER